MKMKAVFTPLDQKLTARLADSNVLLPQLSQLMYLPVPGLTPCIGENGNWWIGDTDTNVSACFCHVPAGGREGQVLGKKSAEDHDLCWKDPVTYTEEYNPTGGKTVIIGGV